MSQLYRFIQIDSNLGVNYSAAAAAGAQERRRGWQRGLQLLPHHRRGDD